MRPVIPSSGTRPVTWCYTSSRSFFGRHLRARRVVTGRASTAGPDFGEAVTLPTGRLTQREQAEDQKEKDQRKGQFPRLSCKRSERQLRPMRKCHSPVDFGGIIKQVLVLAHVQAMILGEALTLDLHMVAHVQLMVLQAHGKASNLDLHVWWRSWWFLRHILTCMWSWWHTARRRRLTFTLRHSFKFSLFCSLPARHRVEMRKRNCDSLTSQCHYVFEFVWFSPHLACQPPCLTQSIQVLYSPPPLMMKTRLYQRIVLRTVGLGQCDIKNKEIY